MRSAVACKCGESVGEEVHPRLSAFLACLFSNSVRKSARQSGISSRGVPIGWQFANEPEIDRIAGRCRIRLGCTPSGTANPGQPCSWSLLEFETRSTSRNFQREHCVSTAEH